MNEKNQMDEKKPGNGFKIILLAVLISCVWTVLTFQIAALLLGGEAGWIVPFRHPLGLVYFFLTTLGVFFLLRGFLNQGGARQPGKKEAAPERHGSIFRSSHFVGRSKVGLFACDQYGRVVDANRAMFELLGSKGREEFFVKVNNDDSFAGSPKWLDILKQAEEPAGYQENYFKINKANGTPVYVQLRLIKVDTANDWSFEGVIVDQTAQKERQDQLAAKEAHFRALVELSTFGIYLLQDDVFVYTNPRFAEMFGYSEHEIIGKLTKLEIAAEEDHDMVNQKIVDQLERRVAKSHYIFRGRRKDGIILDVEAHGALIEHEGRPAIFGFLMDITDRRRGALALQASEQKYRRLVNNLRTVVFQCDSSGIWTFLSPAWEPMSGYSVNETLGKVFSDIIYPEDRDFRVKMFVECIQQEREIERYTCRVICKDGSIKWAEVNPDLIRDEQGRIIGISGTFDDITERILAEKALRESEEKYHDLLNKIRSGEISNISDIPGIDIQKTEKQ